MKLQMSYKQKITETQNGPLFRIVNSYLLMPGYVTSSFCDVSKVTSCDLTPFHYFFTQLNVYFLKLCLVRSTITCLCPNTNNFDALDFSECRSEEEIRFFWRSV